MFEMKKMIISYDERIKPERVLEVVGQVVAKGRVCKIKDRDHYCWATTFEDCVVSTLDKRPGQTLDSLRVFYKGK